ncbi:MAG: hypothetical protein HON65_07320 [Rhodospirillales bacterium]|jgi:flagellar M-ring protein FliF|nr:hypothetical protein [Rhodospirillales bacterium]
MDTQHDDFKAKKPLDNLLDLDRVEGKLNSSSVRKVSEIVERHPDEALSIIRNWLHQDN